MPLESVPVVMLATVRSESVMQRGRFLQNGGALRSELSIRVTPIAQRQRQPVRPIPSSESPHSHTRRRMVQTRTP